MSTEFLEIPICSQEPMFTIYSILNPRTQRFLTEFPYNLALQEQASQHYYNQGSMNQVEQMLFYSGVQMARLLNYLFPNKTPAAVIGIPRSGWAVANGVAAELSLPIYYSNQGNDLIPGRPILGPSVLADLQNKTVVVADDILWGNKQPLALRSLLHSDVIFAIPAIDKYQARELDAATITAFAPSQGFENYLRYLLD